MNNELSLSLNETETANFGQVETPTSTSSAWDITAVGPAALPTKSAADDVALSEEGLPLPTIQVVQLSVSALSPHSEASAIPSGSPDEDARLLQSMKDNGFDQRQPLHVVEDATEPGKYIILDGLRKFSTAKLLGLKFLPCIILASNIDQVRYMKDAAWNRRNIRSIEKVLAMKDELAALQAQAKQNQRNGGKHKGKLSQNSGKAIHLDKEIAKRTELSHDSVHRILFVAEHAPEMVKQLRAGTVSVNKAYEELKKKVNDEKQETKRKKAIAALPAAKPVIGFENQIIRGDSRQVLDTIPDGVVTAVVTSPPYFIKWCKYDKYVSPEKYADYLALLESVFAKCFKTLRKGGRLFVNLDTPKHDIIAGNPSSGRRDAINDLKNILYKIGYLYFGEVIWFKQTTPGSKEKSAWGTYCDPTCPSIRPNHEVVLVFCKETRELKAEENEQDLIDMTAEDFRHATISTWNYDAKNKCSADNSVDSFWYVRTAGGREIHKYPFPPKLVELILKSFTRRGNLILDPFNGSGTTTLVASQMGRRYVGIDISKKYCRLAQKRLADAQNQAAQTQPTNKEQARDE